LSEAVALLEPEQLRRDALTPYRKACLGGCYVLQGEYRRSLPLLEAVQRSSIRDDWKAWVRQSLLVAWAHSGPVQELRARAALWMWYRESAIVRVWADGILPGEQTP
jgi:hypothetical protein